MSGGMTSATPSLGRHNHTSKNGSAEPGGRRFGQSHESTTRTIYASDHRRATAALREAQLEVSVARRAASWSRVRQPNAERTSCRADEKGAAPRSIAFVSALRIPPMVVVCVRGPLRKLAGGRAEHELEGATVLELLRALEVCHPDIGGWVLDERGLIRRHINVFVNGERGGETTAVRSGDRIEVVPAITGG
jgi:sulfur-carrier protein